MLSPRQHAFDAWHDAARACLRAKNNISKVGSVLMCAVVALGPVEFFQRFDCDNADDFRKKNGPDRSLLFANSKKLPTGTALSCLKIAPKMHVVVKNYGKMPELERELFKFMKVQLAQDSIYSVRQIDRAEDISRLVNVILKFASWNKPRDLLLEANTDATYGRQLQLMSAMFECAPTPHETNMRVVETCVDNASVVAASAYGLVSRVTRAVQNAPAAAPAEETDWNAVVVTSGQLFLCWWLWAYYMYHVAATWIEHAHVSLSEPYAKATAEFGERPLCEWDMPVLMCVLVFTMCRGHQSAAMLLLSVGLLSLQTATSLPMILYVGEGFLTEMRLCKFKFYSPVNKADSESCDNKAIRLQLVCTFAFCVAAIGFGIMYLLDMATVLVLYLRVPNADQTAPIYHIPHCFHMCTLYVVTSIGIALQEFVPVRVTHTVNFVLFLLCGGRTCLARYSHEEDLWTTRLSLYASRCICFFVVGTAWFANSWHGHETWASLTVGYLFQQAQCLTVNLFGFFVLVAVHNAIRPNRRVVCVLSW